MHHTRPSRRSLCALIIAPLLFSASGVPRAPDRLAALPPTVLWAWERPEQLQFIDTRTTGVAFLAGTVSLRHARFAYRPRFQTLRVPNAARLIAVVRLETTSSDLNAEQRSRTVAAIVAAARAPRVVAVQVDFDATTSQRVFYRDLLVDLRRQLPPAMPISITALASWCTYDDWISGLPVDEAVPMLFRMGRDDAEIQRFLAAGKDFSTPLCRGSLGISTDEPLPHLPAGRRTYIFNPRAWSQDAAARAVAEVQP